MSMVFRASDDSVHSIIGGKCSVVLYPRNVRQYFHVALGPWHYVLSGAPDPGAAGGSGRKPGAKQSYIRKKTDELKVEERHMTVFEDCFCQRSLLRLAALNKFVHQSAVSSP